MAKLEEFGSVFYYVMFYSVFLESIWFKSKQIIGSFIDINLNAQ